MKHELRKYPFFEGTKYINGFGWVPLEELYGNPDMDQAEKNSVRKPAWRPFEGIQMDESDETPVSGVRRAIVGYDLEKKPTCVVFVMNPRHIDCWQIAGGRIEERESLEEAKRREVEEETGIHLDAVDEKKEFQIGNFADRKGYVFDFGVIFIPEKIVYDSVMIKKHVGDEGEIIRIFPVEILEKRGFMYSRHERGENAPLFSDHREPVKALKICIKQWEREHAPKEVAQAA